MSPHTIGPGLLVFVTQETYGEIMVKELVCRLRVLGSSTILQAFKQLVSQGT